MDIGRSKCSDASGPLAADNIPHPDKPQDRRVTSAVKVASRRTSFEVAGNGRGNQVHQNSESHCYDRSLCTSVSPLLPAPDRVSCPCASGLSFAIRWNFIRAGSMKRRQSQNVADMQKNGLDARDDRTALGPASLNTSSVSIRMLRHGLLAQWRPLRLTSILGQKAICP